MNQEIEKLIIEQSKESNYKCVKPQIITPTKQKPFSLIKSTRKRIVFYAYLAGENYHKMSKVLKHDWRTIKSWVSECLELYPEYKK